MEVLYKNQLDKALVQEVMNQNTILNMRATPSLVQVKEKEYAMKNKLN
jgi:hypothetical protein